MRSTRDRILEVALDLFGTRGVDAVSLDEIARAVGVRKQTVLYWFASKDDLVDEVLAVAATELVVVIDAALRAAPDDPLDRIDAVVRAVFRPAVRRPALLGLVREVSRLESDQATGSGSDCSRSSTVPSTTSAPRWTPVGSDGAIPASSPRSATRRSPASPPSPRCSEPSAGRPTRRACAASATNSERSSALPSPRDPQRTFSRSR